MLRSSSAERHSVSNFGACDNFLRPTSGKVKKAREEEMMRKAQCVFFGMRHKMPNVAVPSSEK